MKAFLLSALLCAGLVWAAPKAPGWFAAGNRPDAYEMGLDTRAPASGHACAMLRSLPDAGLRPGDFGTYMQTASIGGYGGKRVRLTAKLKTQSAERGMLWLRFDHGGSVVAFDNMDDRPIQGTTGWSSVAIVLDVPPEADLIAFGGMLAGTGTLWFDELRFEVVDTSVPVTARSRRAPSPPANLGFEDVPDGG